MIIELGPLWVGKISRVMRGGGRGSVEGWVEVEVNEESIATVMLYVCG